MTAWATPEQAKRHWADAKALDPATLLEVLACAELECRRFAKALPDAGTDLEVVPINYTIGTVEQAREVWAAASRDGGAIAGEVYAIKPRPLLDAVKQRLRPARARKAIG